MAISDLKAVENMFSSHLVPPEDHAKTNMVREGCLELAKLLIVTCPENAERTLAIRALEEVMFRANSSIARQHPIEE